MRGGKEQPADEAHRLAAQGISGAASPLPHLDPIQRSFGSHDVSGIKAHIGGTAARASQGMGAEAYATGDHVAFRATPDLHTAAHEAAHVMQQRQGVQLKGGVGQAGDRYERQADAVADAVVAGQSAEPLLGPPGRSTAASHIQKQERSQEAPALLTLMYYIEGDRVIIAPRPAEDTQEARQQAFDQAGATTCPVEISEVGPSDRTWPLFYALYLDQRGRDAEIDWDLLGHTVGEMAQSGGLGETPLLPAEVLEGNVSQSTVASGTMQPGPWSPPGNQPIPFYIGNQAHIAIAAYYVGLHGGEQVFTNFTPLSTILEQLQLAGIPGIDPRSLGSAVALRPDILNISRRHLYEIKPAQSQALAASEASIYVAALARAGIVVTLGPTSDPGANGVIPAPAGFFRFWSPAPGVVVYQYSREQPEPVRVPVTETQPQEQPDFQVDRILEWEYWEEVTGLTGIALLLYLVVSEGSRLYPPRNFVPVP